MPVDFTRAAHILTVHGVQTGTSDDIDSDRKIRKLVDRSLANSHIERDYTVSGYFYEDINDNAQRIYKIIASAISRGNPLLGRTLKTVIDLAGDVVTAAGKTSTAGRIRRGLREQILESYRNGNQLVLVAHSLGTIYALDVIGELINDPAYYHGDDIRTWPVQGFISMGSPLGLDLNILGKTIFEKRRIAKLDAGYSVFPWHNFYNRLDPVVSGNVFGQPVEIRGSRGPVEKRYGADTKAANWLLQGHAITSGKQWLLAHTSYWRNAKIGDQIVNMLWD